MLRMNDELLNQKDLIEEPVIDEVVDVLHHVGYGLIGEDVVIGSVVPR